MNKRGQAENWEEKEKDQEPDLLTGCRESGRAGNTKEKGCTWISSAVTLAKDPEKLCTCQREKGSR